MAVPESLNARIAFCKGWIRLEKPEPRTYRNTMGDVFMITLCHWRKPDGELVTIEDRPDFVGTLEGVAGMLRELGDRWYLGPDASMWVCHTGENCGPEEFFESPDDRPGDCVGEAYLSMKEADDGS